MGTVLQLGLGTVYAWSYFQNPLVKAYNWSNAQTAWAFSLAICFLGLSAAAGGVLLPKFGPRKLAVTGGLCFGTGYLLAALALHYQSLALLYIGYGVIGGCGLGLGYVTPVATAAKWFPDKKGFITGMVVMGFGLGALLMSKVVAPFLMEYTKGNLVHTFAYCGAIFYVLTITAASFLKNPPAGYVPAGYTPPQTSGAGQKTDGPEITVGDCLCSGKFIMMWLVFFCNITAGIAIIGFQSPMMQDLWKATDPTLSTVMLASYGATLIAITSLFNGVGRFFWGSMSDKIGRVAAFRLMLGTQILIFGLLLINTNPWVFGLLLCYVLLCYGGGFGTMPSFVLDVFGAKQMAVVYGTILTAWSAAGIVGPQIVAIIKDRFPQQASTYSFMMGAAFLIVGFLVTLLLNNKKLEKKSA